MGKAAQKLSNTQLEILKAFSHKLSESDLQKFRQHLSLFFAEIAMDEADKIWDSEKWNEKKIEELLTQKLRSGKGS